MDLRNIERTEQNRELASVEIAGKKKKDGFEEHRKNRAEQGISFWRTGYLRKK